MDSFYSRCTEERQKLIDFVVSKVSAHEMKEARKALNAVVCGHFYDFDRNPRAWRIASLFMGGAVSTRVYLLKVGEGKPWVVPAVCGYGADLGDAQRNMIARGFPADQAHDAYLVLTDRADLTNEEVDQQGLCLGGFNYGAEKRAA